MTRTILVLLLLPAAFVVLLALCAVGGALVALGGTMETADDWAGLILEKTAGTKR